MNPGDLAQAKTRQNTLSMFITLEGDDFNWPFADTVALEDDQPVIVVAVVTVPDRRETTSDIVYAVASNGVGWDYLSFYEKLS